MGNHIYFFRSWLAVQIIFPVFKQWKQRRREVGDEVLLRNLQKHDQWGNYMDNADEENYKQADPLQGNETNN